MDRRTTSATSVAEIVRFRELTVVASPPNSHDFGSKSRTTRLGTFQPRIAGWAWAALLLLALGCSSTRYTTIRKIPDTPLAERLSLTSRGGPKPSARTVDILRRYDLESAYEREPEKVLEQIQTRAVRDPSTDHVYAIAELSFIAGKRAGKDQTKALHYFGASVAHAYNYLLDGQFVAALNPYDPQFRAACDLYNGALEECLRGLRQNKGLTPGKTQRIQLCDQLWTVSITSRGEGWKDEDFERFEFASDYEVGGLRNKYRTFGLGVPLIAVRKKRAAAAGAEPFYPPELSFPVTAFLRVLPDPPGMRPGMCREHRAVLELYDPLLSANLSVDQRRVPLESDLTTPLAFFLDQGKLPPLATLGLLKPDESAKLRGLYLSQPYDPQKIPIVFVHGLWSDPTTWAEMFNDLRGSPDVRQSYQFWFYFYPSGQPFWYSAAQLRGDLAKLRSEVDPQRNTPALDQMVLVGHSMGGLVSKLQSLDGGDDYWKTASTTPFPVVKASHEVQQTLSQTYYFKANPSVRRVITIGTPHRGSKFANSTTRYLADQLIKFPKMLVRNQQELFKKNPEAFGPGSSVRVNTSVDSLAPDSPFLPVMLAAPRPPGVHYHNVVGVKGYPGQGPAPPDGTDGIVSFASAHLDNVDSELVVNADHLGVHRHPLTMLEMQRILEQHLQEMQKETAPRNPIQLVKPNQPASPVQTVNAVQPEPARLPDTEAVSQPAPVGATAQSPVDATTATPASAASREGIAQPQSFLPRYGTATNGAEQPTPPRRTPLFAPPPLR